MNEESKLKSKKTREENERKLWDLKGYEIRKDKMQFIVIKDGHRWYFTSLLSLFRDLNKETNDFQIESGVKLSELVQTLEKRDKQFFEGLKSALKGLPDEPEAL